MKVDHVAVTEEVYHQFNRDQLPDDLIEQFESGAIDECEFRDQIREWFCNLKNPYAEAANAGVHERHVAIYEASS